MSFTSDVTNATVQNETVDGNQNVNNGGVTIGNTVVSGGSVSVNNGGTVIDTLVEAGGKSSTYAIPESSSLTYAKDMVLSTDPYVVYPGCTQGRSSKDSGPRGAYLVTVQDGSVVRTDFITLCAIEWTDVRVTIGMDMDLPAFVAAASSRCRPGSLVRLFADGTGPLNSKLRLYGPDVRRLFEEATGCICTGLEVSTLPEIDLDERSRSGDFTAMVISHGREMAKSMSRQEIIDAICFTGASSYLRPIFESMDSEELRGLLEDAVAFVVEKMREAESR